jgi:hypothetical protein
MPGGGGDHSSRGAIAAARERERQVVQLAIRGLNWGEIARQLGMGDESTARKAFERAVKRIPKKDVEMLRTLQSERLNDARRRVYSELAGRQERVPDPEHPGQMTTITVRPTIQEVYDGVDRIVRIDIREANLYGLDAPKKSDIVESFTVGPPSLSDEEIEIRMSRLTEEEQGLYLKLITKMDGRWVEPPRIEDKGVSVETTAVMVRVGGASAERDSG